MHYVLWFLAFAVIVFLTVKAIKYKSLYPFMPFKYNFGKRRITFAKALELLNERQARVMIETGTSRNGLRNAKSDGAATIVFGKWAKLNNAFLHSVDINEESTNAAQKEVYAQDLQEYVKIHLSDSLAFLERFDENVDFLYLDSYDYSNDPEVQLKSQTHHLKEFKIIENRLHEKTIVLIDDCRLPNGGKGKLVVDYMVKKDWKILMNEYQILLIRK